MTAYKHPTAGVCLRTGKLQYVSRKEAKRAVKARGYRDVSVYACTDCGHIHIGGWHGIKDRVLHRAMHDGVEPAGEPGVPIRDAAEQLGVTADALRRVVASGAVRGTDEDIHPDDVQRLRECTWRKP